MHHTTCADAVRKSYPLTVHNPCPQLVHRHRRNAHLCTVCPQTRPCRSQCADATRRSVDNFVYNLWITECGVKKTPRWRVNTQPLTTAVGVVRTRRQSDAI